MFKFDSIFQKFLFAICVVLILALVGVLAFTDVVIRTALSVVLVQCLVVILVYFILDRFSVSNADENEKAQSEGEENKHKGHVIEAFTAALEKINTVVEVDDIGRRSFKYQGEVFCVDIDDDCYHVLLWDLHWYQVPLSDLEKFSSLKTAINKLNQTSNCAVSYVLSTEDNVASVVTRRNITFLPDMPSPEYYLESTLQDMLRLHQSLIESYLETCKEYADK